LAECCYSGFVTNALARSLVFFGTWGLAGCNAVAASAHDDTVPAGTVATDAGSLGDSGSDAPSVTLEIGVPDRDKSSAFAELAQDGDVQIQDGGQGGTHALIALRFSGFGQWVYYQVSIRDPEGGGEVQTPDLIRPRPMLCDDALFECRYSPILVVIGGLAPKEEWDGLHVEITAVVRNEDGAEATAVQTAYLRR
jgi:hypothetical protein